MSVYLKLQEVRVELQKLELKKSGEHKRKDKNTGKYFVAFKYYELSDFLPKAMELFLQKKLFSFVNYYTDRATLTILDTEKPDERIEYECDSVEAQLVGGSKIQELGAKQTYMRRYLYTTALEIVEADAVDLSVNDNEERDKEKKASIKKSTLTDAQLKRLFAITKASGKSSEEVKSIMKEKFNKDSSKDLTKYEYDELCKELEGK